MSEFIGQAFAVALVAAFIWSFLHGLHHAGDVVRDRHGKAVSRRAARAGFVLSLAALCWLVFRLCAVGGGYELILPALIALYYARRFGAHLLRAHPS
ncbi:MAG: hypothetical protein LBM64_06510 [Deltaproteobacteria bacterium]|jgi:uncharacterized PurR-regulated membrane protein YhhQ (DUF165 family)|nr:hypothetical protein [Deltaproteobacteria bacterium]